MAKEKKPKKPFMSGYKTYNPKEEGYGSAENWQSAFNKRMNFEEAIGILQENDPYSILGVKKTDAFDVIKKAFRKLMMIHHPDKNPGNEIQAKEMSQKIIAAYVVLEKRHL